MGDDRLGGERERESALCEPLLEDEGSEPEGLQLPDQEPESGEEDARSLAEEALDARIVAPQDSRAQDDKQSQVKHTAGQAAEEDVAAVQAAEEAALAAEEEQAVLDAQRKAAEKAAREGLLASEARKTRTLSQADIEGEAEAAAGGFDVDENDGPLDDGREAELDRDGYYDVDDDEREQEHSEADGPYYDEEDAQPAVIHHHHYYDYHPAEEQGTDPLSSSAPRSSSTVQGEPDEDGPDEEDEADMAGLGLGPRKKSAHSATRGSQGTGRSRDGGSTATDRDRERLRRGSGSHSGSGSGSAAGSAALSKRSGEKHYQYGAVGPSGVGRELPAWTRGTPSLGSSSNSGARRYQLPASAAAKVDDSAADAAAGGFDEWDVPPSAPGDEEHGETGDDEAVQEDVWGSPSSHISPRKMSYRERRYLGGEATSRSSGDGGGAGSSDGGRSSGGRSGRSKKERRATAMDNGLEEADGL
jgi:hypothetical protein